MLAWRHAYLLAYPSPKGVHLSSGFALWLGFLRRLTTASRVAKGSTLGQSDWRNLHPDLNYKIGRLAIKPRGGDRPSVKERKCRRSREIGKIRRRSNRVQIECIRPTWHKYQIRSLSSCARFSLGKWRRIDHDEFGAMSGCSLECPQQGSSLRRNYDWRRFLAPFRPSLSGSLRVHINKYRVVSSELRCNREMQR